MFVLLGRELKMLGRGGGWSGAGRFGCVRRKVCVEARHQLAAEVPEAGTLGDKKRREGCWEAAARGQRRHLAAAPPPPERDGLLRSFGGVLRERRCFCGGRGAAVPSPAACGRGPLVPHRAGTGERGSENAVSAARLELGAGTGCKIIKVAARWVWFGSLPPRGPDSAASGSPHPGRMRGTPPGAWGTEQRPRSARGTLPSGSGLPAPCSGARSQRNAFLPAAGRICEQRAGVCRALTS